jgi:capsular polysaccharide biosynthesis protein
MQLPLDIKYLENITILPMEEITTGFGFSLGAFHEDGSFAEEFELKRNWGASSRITSPSQAIERIDKPVVYGGVLGAHFGHFILESLSRVWAIKLLSDEIEIVWNKLGATTLKKWQEDFFLHHRIDIGRFRIVKSPTLFRSMLVPSPGYVIQLHASRAHLESISFECAEDEARDKKVWLSRSGLPDSCAAITNEGEVDRELAESGWEIVRPETLQLEEQIAMIHRAKVVAGFEGSAFHALAIASRTPDLVVIFSRSDYEVNRNYTTIAQAKNINQVIHRVNLEHLSGTGQVTRYSIRDPRQVLRVLNEDLVKHFGSGGV